MPPVLQKTIREIHQRLRALETREYAEVVGPGSVVNAQYLTLAFHAVLTAERRFVDGDGLVGVDGGANADYTLNARHALLSTSHIDTLAAAVVDGDVIIGNVTPAWSRLAIAIPAANVRNVLGIDNAELRPSWKTALDNVNPANIGVAAPGVSLIFSHRDHVHAHPAALGANLHHTQIHAVVGGDHTLTGVQWNLVGATALNTIGLLLPLSDVSGPAEAILKSDAQGDLTVHDLTATGQLSAGAGIAEGLILGADAQWYRSAANMLRTPDSVTIDVGLNLGLGTGATAGRIYAETDQANCEIRLAAYKTAATWSVLRLSRARGTQGTPLVVADDDLLGGIIARGYSANAGAFRNAAEIAFFVDGEPDTDADTSDMPGRILFLTTPDGSSTTVERMRIDNAGFVTIAQGLNIGTAIGAQVDQIAIGDAVGEAWSLFQGVQCGLGGFWGGRDNINAATGLANAFYDGAWKRMRAGHAIRLNLTQFGEFSLQTAGTDVADSAIAWDTRLTMDIGGTLSVVGGLNVGTATGAAAGQIKTSEAVLCNGLSVGAYTVRILDAAGEITVETETFIRLDSFGEVGDDDLVAINGGVPGQLLVLFTRDSSRDVTVKDGGTLYLAGDMVLDSFRDRLTLFCYVGDSWYELSRSNNA